MEWIERSFAQVNIQVLDDILRWTINLLQGFSLDVGTGDSFFEKTIPLDTFSDPIAYLSLAIILFGTIVKLYVTMLSPFDTAESPSAIAVRSAGAVFGVGAAKPLFVAFEEAFNYIYLKFQTAYSAIATAYEDTIEKSNLEYTRENFNALERFGLRLWQGATGLFGWVFDSDTLRDMSSETADMFDPGFVLFSSEQLVDGVTPSSVSLGVLILELIIGCSLMLGFFRLVLEAYERYVLLGFMYFSAPLAASSLISRNSVIFANWMKMVLAQFILMCANLVFIGGFMYSIYNLRLVYDDKGYVFASSSEYIATMLALTGWLLIGQKFDQHLKGLGLSTTQTGAGIMGALAGGAVLARASFGAATTAGKWGVRGAKVAGKGVGKAATGAVNIGKAAYEQFGQFELNNKIARDLKEAPVMTAADLNALKDGEKKAAAMDDYKNGLAAFTDTAGRTEGFGDFNKNGDAFIGGTGAINGEIAAYDLSSGISAIAIPQQPGSPNAETPFGADIGGEHYAIQYSRMNQAEIAEVMDSPSYQGHMALTEIGSKAKKA